MCIGGETPLKIIFNKWRFPIQWVCFSHGLGAVAGKDPLRALCLARSASGKVPLLSTWPVGSPGWHICFSGCPLKLRLCWKHDPHSAEMRSECLEMHPLISHVLLFWLKGCPSGCIATGLSSNRYVHSNGSLQFKADYSNALGWPFTKSF